jgi:aspartate/methionine/tyrosine aminotransferase
MLERTVILYTFSKKFAMTGWRLGAAIAPIAVAESIAKLNTNDESCTTHFVQAAGVAGITGPTDSPQAILDELHRRRDAAWGALAKIDGVVCPKPESTFYLFPKVTDIMARMGFDEVGKFATAALHNTGVSFCTRKHFGRPQPGESDHFVRFAYSGLSCADIEEGLSGLRRWIESA